MSGSPVHAYVISRLLGEREIRSIIIQFRGMSSVFPGEHETYSCPDESLLSARIQVLRMVERFRAIEPDPRNWAIFTSHGDSLLARIVCAAGGRIHYVDDGLGTYASLIDRPHDGTLFQKLLLMDLTFKKPLLDRNLRYLSRRPLTERVLNSLIGFFVGVSPRVAVFIGAVSRRLYKQYFRFDESSDWTVELICDVFKRDRNVRHCPVTVSPPVANGGRKALVLLPPFEQTDATSYDRFMRAAAQICDEKRYDAVRIKPHPCDAARELQTDAFDALAATIDVVDFSLPMETSVWAYGEGFAEVICFNTSSTFYHSMLFSASDVVWTDLFEAITGERSASDVVSSALQSSSDTQASNCRMSPASFVGSEP